MSPPPSNAPCCLRLLVSARHPRRHPPLSVTLTVSILILYVVFIVYFVAPEWTDFLIYARTVCKYTRVLRFLIFQETLDFAEKKSLSRV